MATPTRILYIQPNSETGGSDHCLFRLIHALDRRRYEPIAVLPQDGPMVPLLAREGVPTRFLKMEQLRTLPSVRYQARYLSGFWPTVTQLAQLIQDEHVDLVHTNSLYSLYGAWAARRARRPHVWHLREIPPAVPIARTLLGKLVVSLSASIVAMSQACVRGLLPQGDVSGKVKLLADAIDLTEFRTDISGQRVRHELGLSPETPLVGFVARLDPWKGLDVFLRAAALLRDRFPDVHFIVAGGAPPGFESYEKKMRTLAAALQLGERVHFLGWRYKLNDIPELMAALTVFSHTSTKPEPFGLVLIEAMAMQRPIVAAKAGGPLEIVAEKTSGYLTPPGNPEAHAEAVATLLANPAQAQLMGQMGRRRVEEVFSVERFSHDLNHIYDSTLGTNA